MNEMCFINSLQDASKEYLDIWIFVGVFVFVCIVLVVIVIKVSIVYRKNGDLKINEILGC